MKTPLALLLVLPLAGCLEAPDDAPDPIDDDDLASTESELIVGADNPFGTLSMASPGWWAWNVGGTNNVWRPIPGLSAVAHARAGDHLEVDVSADINSSSTAETRLRVLVDGVVASPGDVVFRSGGTSHARSFRFVRGNLTAGAHVVEVQWSGDTGGTLTDHTLSVRTGAPSWGDGRLITTAWADTLTTKTSATWQDIPGMWMLIANSVPRDLVLSGSFEASSSGGGVKVRALVDGVVVDETTLLPTSSARGARSFVYHVSNIAQGLHSVSFQWIVGAGGTARMWDRTMTAYTGPWLGSLGGISGQTTAGLTTVTSSAWTPLTEHTVYTYAATEVSTITLSAEAAATGGELWVRALVDGVVAHPGDIAMTTDAATAAHTLTFQARNIQPGAHQFRIETRLVPTTGSVHTATIRDRNLAIIHNKRHGVDFASTPLAGMQPRHRDFPVLAICFDAKSPVSGGPAPAFAPGELFQTFVGWDGKKNVYDWFMENSAGRVEPIIHAAVGCYQPPCAPWAQPNTEWCRTDGWYWGAWQPALPAEQQSAEHWRRLGLMQEDALRAADADINFAAYDTNADHRVDTEEAIVVIIKPQFTEFGQCCGAKTVNVDGQSLTIAYVDAYAAPDDADANNERTRRVGLLAHEISHAVLGADDLYGATGLDTTSIMSMFSAASHLDPGHKLANGLVTPTAIEMTEWTTQTVTVPAVESSSEILLLHDRSRPTEVFLIENRFADPSNYDGFEVANTGATPPASGIWIWRVDLATPQWGDPTNDRVKLMRAPALADPATRYCLEYRDGTRAKVAAVLSPGTPGTGATVQLGLERLTNPAACVNIDPPSGGGGGGLGL
jgi:M6 family metalloprotease-like protein